MQKIYTYCNTYRITPIPFSMLENGKMQTGGKSFVNIAQGGKICAG